MARVGKLLAGRAVAPLLALGGAAVYLVQTVSYALTQKSMLDEGFYLYKGLLFASGVYRPFQDYGPWTHKAPLAYLIPGYIQAWFGPGLLTGRVFAVLVSLLVLLAVWLTARRLGGARWAAAAVWAMALNPALLKYYAIASVEGLVACLLVWALYLTVGGRRPAWQAILGAALAALLAMTRQNMMVVLPLLVLYLWWEYGWRRAAWAAAAGLGVLVLIHWVYWPGILRMWAAAVPASLAPFLDPWRPPRGLSADWLIQPQFLQQVVSFFSGFRFHFTALTGGLLALLFWPPRRAWANPSQRRTAVFLAVLFVTLTALHLWLGLGYSESNNYNVWGYKYYLAFFAPVGLLLVIALASPGEQIFPVWRQGLAVLLMLVIAAGIGYASYETFAFFLADLPVPRVQNFFQTWRFLPGTVPFYVFVANKFGLTYPLEAWFDPTLAGLLIGLLSLLAALIIWLIRRRRRTAPPASFGLVAFCVFLLTGTLLAPTRLLGGDYREYDCGMNVIAAYETTGPYLASLVPPGSLVYWEGGNAEAVLLYLPGIRIFPAQLDAPWNFWTGGDDDALARYGYWNDSLRLQWRAQAEVFLIQQSLFTPEWQEFLDPARYEELPSNQVPLGCAPDTYLRIFRRK
ncbi:MAG: glycosyltransferase family 39 protein [Anaerolineales bacterium]